MQFKHQGALLSWNVLSQSVLKTRILVVLESNHKTLVVDPDYYIVLVNDDMNQMYLVKVY